MITPTLTEILDLTPSARKKLQYYRTLGYRIEKRWVKCCKKNCRCQTPVYANGHLTTTNRHGPYVYATHTNALHRRRTVYIGRFQTS